MRFASLSVLAAVAAINVSPVPHRAARQPANERAQSPQHGVPKAVVDVGEFGENVYDAVKAGKWSRARTLTTSLTEASRKLTPGERSQVAGAIDSLDQAVTSQSRETALEVSNRVTRLAAHVSEPYSPPVPVAVVLLDYYGRELEIWGGRGDVAKSRLVVDSLRATWTGVRPAVVKAGGRRAAMKTDALVTRLASARSGKEFVALAKPFLDVVDELEKPFEKTSATH